jgi:hypothetical protein
MCGGAIPEWTAATREAHPMLRWFWTIVDVNRARNAAVATIRPLVEDSRRRFDGISDAVWLEPYMLGFLTMLITISAKHTIRRLEGQAMAKVQTEAWKAITGLDYQIGEEIILLSEARDLQFRAGCSDAMRVASDFYSRGVLGAAIGQHSASEDDTGPNGAASPEAIRFLGWSQVFDAYVEKQL